MEDLLDAALLSRLVTCQAVDQQRAVAKGPLAQGEPFLALPLSREAQGVPGGHSHPAMRTDWKCWTADTAKACSKLSSYLDADAPDSTWLALHLLLLKQEQGNALQKQLQLLDDSAGLLRWDDTELALLQGSPWMLVAGQGREEIQAEYEELLGNPVALVSNLHFLPGEIWIVYS
ncbi:unnamed protein product [Cladocopium goreaui]|uniref:Glucuronoxylan glucuronosyltransferase IRX7 n=1 Tax=Cladocopium goreaui TaxID=2562237 RepID=A0A9P1GP97_9DINO|nr:unnamed protein product [Cladocopium goreaui]